MNEPLTEETLFQLLAEFHPLSGELCRDLRTRLKYHEFKQGKFLLRAGSVCERMHFITQGLVHCYYGRASGQDTDFFMAEREIVVAKDSFFGQVRSRRTIEALEDVKTLSLSFADLEELYQKHVEFNINGRKLTELYHRRSDLKADILRLRDPVERFNLMKARRPDLIDRVPGAPLASFMGIARETLSRIRSQQRKKTR